MIDAMVVGIKALLPNESKERRVLGVGSIPVAILVKIQRLWHYSRINMNIIG